MTLLCFRASVDYFMVNAWSLALNDDEMVK